MLLFISKSKTRHCLAICHNGLICLQCKMPECFLNFISEKQHKAPIVYVPNCLHQQFFICQRT